ncbi:hypothetical protein [Hydrocarboniclastica marina]|uniref:hypothetical protein n=1 Tax=Hydrocarboniclastica marina TaxID=2259620 RepID=UPI001C12CE70|nr:hypothetical protein [Hydrocarboniclastica marina]
MDKTAATLADQLLERHVQHELGALSGERLLADLRGEIGEIFKLCEKATLRDMVSPEQINAVIKRNVVDLEIHGGIPELAGEMAQKVRAAPVQKKTRLRDLISAAQVGEFVDEALTLRHQRERLVEHLIEHPLYQELVAELVYHGVVNYIYEENMFSKNVPGIAATMKLGKRMFNKAVPGLDVTLEKNLKAYIGRSLPFLVRQSQLYINGALTDDEIKDTVMAVWSIFEDRTLAELQENVGELELQEFVVLGYEFWQSFRKTGYFKGCYEAVVAHLFDKYGDEPLQALLEDMGVTQAMVETEVEAFAPPLFDELRRRGYLEQILRRRLESFYHSQVALDILGSGSGGEARQAGTQAATAKPAKTQTNKAQTAKARPTAKAASSSGAGNTKSAPARKAAAAKAESKPKAASKPKAKRAPKPKTD